MTKHSVHIEDVTRQTLPGRFVRVLTEGFLTENLTMGYTELPPKTTIGPHHHSQEEVLFVLEGEGEVEIGVDRERVRAGTMVHFPCDVPHRFINESDKQILFVFCFSPKVVVGSYDPPQAGRS